MTAKCPVCGLVFPTKERRDAHQTYCEILEKHRGRTYTLICRRDGTAWDLVHVRKDARISSIRTKHMYDYPEELEISHGIRVFEDGSYSYGYRIFNLLALERIVSGDNDYFFAMPSTSTDIRRAKRCMGDFLTEELSL